MDAIPVSIRKLITLQYSVTLSALAFAIPLLFSSPQLITGTLVNCLLFLAAERMSIKKTIPTVILPSLGAAAHGILFGPQTIFLYFFLPFIWLGNFVLVWTFTKFPSWPYIGRIIGASMVKFLILQLFALLYFQFKIVPFVFVSSMGYIQLITALLGGLLAFGISTSLQYE